MNHYDVPGWHPYLVVGMPVTYNSGEGTESKLSGLVMYLVVPQNTEQAYRAESFHSFLHDFKTPDDEFRP
jgi:hypothetical protein